MVLPKAIGSSRTGSMAEASPATQQGVPLIDLRDISRVYGQGEAEVRALDHVSLNISAGEFVAIMGPSGSGKSTAMNVIGCLDTPTSGTTTSTGSRWRI